VAKRWGETNLEQPEATGEVADDLAGRCDDCGGATDVDYSAGLPRRFRETRSRGLLGWLRRQRPTGGTS